MVSVFLLRAIGQLENQVCEVVVVDLDAAAVENHLRVASAFHDEIIRFGVQSDNRWVLLDAFADESIAVRDEFVCFAQ